MAFTVLIIMEGLIYSRVFLGVSGVSRYLGYLGYMQDFGQTRNVRYT